MSKCSTDGRAKIIKGSKAEFDLFVVDDEGRAKNIANYTAGNLVFLNCDGERTVVTLDVPGMNGGAGKISVEISDVQTAFADEKWKDADLELTDAGDELTVIPLADMFEIVKRFAPPPAP